jgi:hypothetical protein
MQLMVHVAVGCVGYERSAKTTNCAVCLIIIIVQHPAGVSMLTSFAGQTDKTAVDAVALLHRKMTWIMALPLQATR